MQSPDPEPSKEIEIPALNQYDISVTNISLNELSPTYPKKQEIKYLVCMK